MKGTKRQNCKYVDCDKMVYKFLEKKKIIAKNAKCSHSRTLQKAKFFVKGGFNLILGSNFVNCFLQFSLQIEKKFLDHFS